MAITNAQKSQLGFFLFTVVQIFVFLYAPQVYKDPMEGIDGKPDFAALRLIGTKEIGLMTIYLSGIVGNDPLIAYMTIVGRSSVLLVMPMFVVVYGAPIAALAGVIQDVFGLSATLYFLQTEKQGKRVESWRMTELASYFPRMSILAGGVWEVTYGWSLMQNPTSIDIMPKPIFGPPTFIGARMFGYMTWLVGLYQIAITLFPTRDDTVYLAVAFHHICFFTFTTFGLTAITGKQFRPPIEHLVFGASLLLGLAASTAYSRLSDETKTVKTD